MKSCFHACEDCKTPAACAQYAQTKQGLPCLPASSGGHPLPTDRYVSHNRSLKLGIPQALQEPAFAPCEGCITPRGCRTNSRCISKMVKDMREDRQEAVRAALAVEVVSIEVAKLGVVAGDTLAVKLPPGDVSQSMQEQILLIMRAAVPEGVNVILMMGGIELQVIKKAGE